MAVKSLAYIRVESRDLDAWHRFGEVVLGAAAESDGQALLLRIDDRPWRFRIEHGEQDRFLAAGLECATEADYRSVLGKLRDAGIDLAEGLADAAKLRHVLPCVRSMSRPTGLIP